MEHITKNKFKWIECATVILLISILLISSVSARSGHYWRTTCSNRGFDDRPCFPFWKRTLFPG